MSSIAYLSTAPSLLVCLDFDGTISELNPDPYAVKPHPVALEAIERLAHAPNTEVAMLSGRHLEGLRRVFPLRNPVAVSYTHLTLPTILLV